jgi:signal transduction histidine kinase
MISHKLVKEFGGTFEVDSKPDKGSIFTFSIKLSSEQDLE